MYLFLYVYFIELWLKRSRAHVRTRCWLCGWVFEQRIVNINVCLLVNLNLFILGRLHRKPEDYLNTLVSISWIKPVLGFFGEDLKNNGGRANYLPVARRTQSHQRNCDLSCFLSVRKCYVNTRNFFARSFGIKSQELKPTRNQKTPSRAQTYDKHTHA